LQLEGAANTFGRPLALPGGECQIESHIDRQSFSSSSDARGAYVAAGIPSPRREEECMKIQPLHDRILVKRIEEENKTKGGIIIPDSAKEKPQEGKVIAVGKGRVLDDGKVQELTVKKGDKILFSKYSGTDVKLDGEEHMIIREDDVLAILE
jgi:chaperonin GroES